MIIRHEINFSYWQAKSFSLVCYKNALWGESGKGGMWPDLNSTLWFIEGYRKMSELWERHCNLMLSCIIEGRWLNYSLTTLWMTETWSYSQDNVVYIIELTPPEYSFHSLLCVDNKGSANAFVLEKKNALPIVHHSSIFPHHTYPYCKVHQAFMVIALCKSTALLLLSL